MGRAVRRKLDVEVVASLERRDTVETLVHLGLVVQLARIVGSVGVERRGVRVVDVVERRLLVVLGVDGCGAAMQESVSVDP